MSKVMDCKQEQAMPELTRLLQQLLPSKALKEYGAPEKLLDYFTVNVIQNQKRLLSNSYVPMNYEMIFEIYKGRMD
jgi:4-hydroxybutyrate dehydrogenase